MQYAFRSHSFCSLSTIRCRVSRFVCPCVSSVCAVDTYVACIPFSRRRQGMTRLPSRSIRCASSARLDESPMTHLAACRTNRPEIATGINPRCSMRVPRDFQTASDEHTTVRCDDDCIYVRARARAMRFKFHSCAHVGERIKRITVARFPREL